MLRSEAWEILSELWDNANEKQREALHIAQNDIQFVDLMPDDMVAVVRCRHCIRRGDPGECPMCFLSEGDWDDYTHDDGYCERGERRADNE